MADSASSASGEGWVRSRQTARTSPDLDAAEQPFQPLDVHGLVQTVGDRLIDERMVRNLPVAGQVLETGDLVGEDRRDQILGLHPQDLRRHFPAGAKRGSASDTPAAQRQRAANIGASSIACISSGRRSWR